jgi:hypothetical protein
MYVRYVPPFSAGWLHLMTNGFSPGDGTLDRFVPESEKRSNGLDLSAGGYPGAGGIHRHKAWQLSGLRSSDVVFTRRPKARYQIASVHGEVARKTFQKVAIQC